MKNLLLILTATFFFAYGYAQEDYDEPEVSIDSLLVNIDKTGFTSGVLYDRIFPWAQLNVFNDTVRIAHTKYFEQALLELYKASNEEKFLSHKALRHLYAPEREQNVVDIGVINAFFHTVNYNEENEEEGALRLVNGLFEKIDNEEPAFLPAHVFIAAPLKQYLKGDEIIYRFSNDFLLQNNEEKGTLSSC